jgi:DNA-directed RNA polymerase subunit RPC12/RpoP
MKINKNQDSREMKCPGCNNKVKPVLIPNRIQSAPFFGFGKADLGLPKRKHLLKCPKCGYILSSK